MDQGQTGHGSRPAGVEPGVADDRLSEQALRHRIVVGVDGSFGANAALEWAAAQAVERHTVLDIVAVWEDLAGTGGTPAGEERLEVARERLDRALDVLTRRHRLPERVITAPLCGPPGERLVARARDAELLVLGTTGISSPEIPGGIGLYCLRHSTTPLVFVPSAAV